MGWTDMFGGLLGSTPSGGGLLSNMDPDTVGMLSAAAAMRKASGPSLVPHDYGQVLASGWDGALQGYRDQYKQGQTEQMDKLDLTNKQLSMQQALAKLGYMKQIVGGDEGGGMPSQPAINAPQGNDMPMGGGFTGMAPPQLSDNQQAIQPRQNNSRLNGMLGLSMMDGKLDTAYSIMKDMQTGYGRDAGKYYVDPATGKQSYMMDPTKGFALDGQGNVTAAPGFATANAGIKGAETDATKASEAKFALLPQAYVNADGPNKGRPMGGSQFNYLFPNGAPGAAQGQGGQPQGSAPASPDAPGQFPQSPPGMPADNAQGIRARIAYAQNIADPTERQSFINAVLKSAHGMPNPAQRKYVANTFSDGVAGIPAQPSQAIQLSQMPPQRMPFGQTNNFGQPPQLQSAEEARNVSDAQDINKQRQIAQVNNQETSFKGYKDELLKSVDTGYDLYRRNNMIRDLMKTYQTGLPNAEARTSFASGLQNLFPGNDNVRSLAESINGGKVASAQTMAQVMSSATLKNLQEVLAGNGRINMAEVKQMQAHAESPTSDAGTLNNIMNYQDRFYNDSRKELGSLTQAEKSGTLNPATWRSDYVQTRHDNETGRANAPAADPARTPSQKAINALRLNPTKRADFDAFYGSGTSAKYLGK